MKPRELPSIDELLELFVVDLILGTLTWKERPSYHFATDASEALYKKQRLHKQAGSVRKDGNTYYLSVTIYGVAYPAHRILYKLRTGEEPEKIDHLDGNGLNNRADNIVASDSVHNAQNCRKNSKNTSGFVGVNKQDGKWCARISVNGVEKYLGSFVEFNDVVLARSREMELHQFSKRHGL